MSKPGQMTLDEIWAEYDRLVDACCREPNPWRIQAMIRQRQELLDEARARNSLAEFMKANDAA